MKVLYSWAGLNFIRLDSIWARWKCAQCVDLIQGFLELVGDPPGNENSKSYELQSLKLFQAGEPPSRTCFCCQSCIWEYRSVLVILFYHILTLPGAPIHFLCGQPVRDVALLILQKLKVFLQMFFDSPIKLIELYRAVEKHFEVQ